MYLLSRSTPLIIALPVDEEASQDFLEKHLYEDEAAYHEAFIIADRLAKVPDIEASDTSILAAISVSDVIISHNQAELVQWIDQYSEGNTYWFFSLRNGKALPLKHNGIQTLSSPPYAPSRQITRLFESLPQKQKENAEAQGKDGTRLLGRLSWVPVHELQISADKGLAVRVINPLSTPGTQESFRLVPSPTGQLMLIPALVQHT